MAGLGEFILDLVFPRQCLGCGRLLAGEEKSYICATCLPRVEFKTGFACAFCNAPVVNGKTCPFSQRERRLDQLLVAASYEQRLVEKMVKTLKYRLVRALAETIARRMITYLEKQLKRSLDWPADLTVVPVPLHWRRLNWRGFNQSALLAEKIGEHFGWPLTPEILQRQRGGRPQTAVKSRAARIQNAVGLFSCPRPLPVDSKTVLLIDDLSTTGATLDDCARALKDAGAKTVIGFVFAKNIK